MTESELCVSGCAADTMFHVKRGTVRQWRPRSLYQLRSYPGFSCVYLARVPPEDNGQTLSAYGSLFRPSKGSCLLSRL